MTISLPPVQNRLLKNCKSGDGTFTTWFDMLEGLVRKFNGCYTHLRNYHLTSLSRYIGIENPKEPLSNHFRIDHSQQFPWKLHSSTKLSPGIPGRYYELSQASWWWANLRLPNNFPGFINLSRVHISQDFMRLLKLPSDRKKKNICLGSKRVLW